MNGESCLQEDPEKKEKVYINIYFLFNSFYNKYKKEVVLNIK